ncbi:MAG: patatin-like phospholipase family protein, partial [Lautropia sp.]
SAYAGSSFPAMGRLERRLQKLRFHMIDSSEIPSLQRTDTMMLAHGPFLERLREQGRACAEAWLAGPFDGVGRRATVDIGRLFS